MTLNSSRYGIPFCICSILALLACLVFTLSCSKGIGEIDSGHILEGSLFFFPFQLPIPVLALVLFLTREKPCYTAAWSLLGIWTTLTALFLIWASLLIDDAQNGLIYVFCPIYIVILTPVLAVLLCIIKRKFCFTARNHIHINH